MKTHTLLTDAVDKTKAHIEVNVGKYRRAKSAISPSVQTKSVREFDVVQKWFVR